jgi:DNA replication protein DnaC
VHGDCDRKKEAEREARREQEEREKEEKRAADRALARREAVQRKVISVLSKFPKWEGARVSNVDWMGSANEQLACMAQQWTFADGHVLIIGPTGKSKTMMLSALAHRWGAEIAARGTMDPNFAGLVWAKAYTLADCVRWHKLGDGEPPEIKGARNATVLMLDDLGQENAGGEQTLFALLDDRYDRGAPTLVTSGLTIEQLKSRYGAHLFRRIVESGIGSLIDMHPRGKLQAVK